MGASPDSDGFEQGLQDAATRPVRGVSVVPPWAWSLLALLLGLAFTAWAASLQHRRAKAARDAAFVEAAREGSAAVSGGLQASGRLLRSVQTVFIASNDVDAEEFSNLYRNLRPREEFPSLQAIAYAQREGDAHYRTRLVEPRAGNERVVGLDLSTQPNNLDAVIASRDVDRVAMSAPFRLVQSGLPGMDGLGVTMRLPVYSPGPPPRAVGERRERMRGSLAVSFLVRRLIADSIPADTQRQMRIVVTDATGTAGEVLYDSGGEGQGRTIGHDIAFGGRVWRLAMQMHRGGVPLASEWTQSMLWPGLIASVLFALLAWSVATTRRRALELGLRMSHRFRESEQRFRALNDLLPALVLLARPSDGSVLYANQAACARLGDGVVGVGLDALFEDPALRRRLRAEDGGARWDNVEAVLVSLGADRFWVSTSIARVRVGDEERMLMVATDISEQRQLTELLGYQASHDNLTELYNRREFERQVRRALQAAGGGPASALLYIDLDQFKLINDTSGHLAGDQLLSQLAMVMSEIVAPGDMLARLGGDEFGVLLHEADTAGALALAERLRLRIEAHIYAWEQRTYTISASIGVVMLDEPGMTLREALAQADTACYLAKEHGRNRIHLFSGDDDETIRRRGEMEWANRLRWAIEEGRLLLDYQEVRPLRDDAACEDPHLELLLRLRDEDGRVVAPGAFLPAAERYGLVPQLDRWVIAEAIAHFDQLHASGRAPGRCSLNLSAASLEDEGLADYVLDLIHRHGVPPSRLCFEITETEAVRNLARAVRFIERLRAFGCLVALDDFGAGMSSFGYLKNLPVDIIKIDGSFIRDIEADPMSRSIVDAITEIGHERGLEVVAEWVGDERTIEILRALRVDYGQGFALHRPEPVLYQRAARGRRG
ncbi:MAG TPA: EAL domain-containing protein [Luteimonas sp.]|nr:EAL domain-containing protein [Luteimonas sp.]